jgi:tRNA (cytidine/uridine-2'-O-)-methyltransferase
LNIVLYEPEIAYNTGSVGRTCVAVGARLWLVKPLGFQINDKNLRRAGMDYWQHLDWEAVTNWNALLEKLDGHRFWFFTKTATQIYTDVQFEPHDVLVFGRESSGLPQSLLDENLDRCLKIPIRPEARSLNLSVATSVALYEARRQVGHPL